MVTVARLSATRTTKRPSSSRPSRLRSDRPVTPEALAELLVQTRGHLRHGAPHHLEGPPVRLRAVGGEPHDVPEEISEVHGCRVTAPAGSWPAGEAATSGTTVRAAAATAPERRMDVRDMNGSWEYGGAQAAQSRSVSPPPHDLGRTIRAERSDPCRLAPQKNGKVRHVGRKGADRRRAVRPHGASYSTR